MLRPAWTWTELQDWMMRCAAVYDFHGFLLYTDTVLSDVVVVLLSVVSLRTAMRWLWPAGRAANRCGAEVRRHVDIIHADALFHTHVLTLTLPPRLYNYMRMCRACSCRGSCKTSAYGKAGCLTRRLQMARLQMKCLQHAVAGYVRVVIGFFDSFHRARWPLHRNQFCMNSGRGVERHL